ncbi:transcription factor bHLH111-like isoform X1 [Musa acuminata AAA Group]|uniref:transcription factor bHLH111-like isoform X1 n=1 Tax=Musa acuminata AAA Group TaxID=214697 RepID=UPI0031DDE767
MHAAMAQEGPEVSVASSSTAAHSWWEFNANPFSWSTVTRYLPPPDRRPDLASTYDEADMSISNATSFTNASSHSALSIDSSSADLSGEPVENHHIWNQVLLNVENAGEAARSGQDDGGSFVEVLSSRRELLEPACDDSKRSYANWESHPSSFNWLEKHLNRYDGSIMEPEGATSNLSDLVSNWSIAPPNPHAGPCDAYICPPMANYVASDVVKHEIPISPSYPSHGIVGEISTSYAPSCDQETGAATPFFPRSHSPGSTRYQMTFCSGMAEVPLSCHSNSRASKPHAKGSDLCDGSKEGYVCSSMRGNGRGSGTTEGKNKRSEDTSETVLKKSKYDSSMVSSDKPQVPKVKVAEKISALQQLVSPFGKTDQASVLMETVKCIRSLQDQVQLLSDPYLKSSASKDHNSWGELQRKDKAEAKHDLRSRGLCLVPVSSIPQVHRDNIRPDYWMPTYRSCLYR